MKEEKDKSINDERLTRAHQSQNITQETTKSRNSGLKWFKALPVICNIYANLCFARGDQFFQAFYCHVYIPFRPLINQ